MKLIITIGYLMDFGFAFGGMIWLFYHYYTQGNF